MEPTLRKDNDQARFAPATGRAGAPRSQLCRNKAQAILEGLRDLKAALSLRHTDRSQQTGVFSCVAHSRNGVANESPVGGAGTVSRRYRIGQAILAEDDAAFGAVVAEAYRAQKRPVCLCCDSGAAMYIARIGEQFLIKRMPLSGADHDPHCQSYEAPYELSGLGPLIGGAIQIDPKNGMAALKLDFSLSKRGALTGSGGAAQNEGPVKNEIRKLSLRALLHYLWHQGGLTEWTAHWAGKRHWFQVRSHLIDAAATMAVKGGALTEHLFVPENFRLDDKAAMKKEGL